MREKVQTPAALFVAISAAMLTLTPRAHAVTCSNGICVVDNEQHTVDGVAENNLDWILNNGVLHVQGGATTRRITSSASALDLTSASALGGYAGESDYPAINAQDGTAAAINGSRIGYGGTALTGSGPLLRLSGASIADITASSVVSGAEIGVQLDRTSAVHITGSQVAGTVAGVLTAGGEVLVDQGGKVAGGISIALNDGYDEARDQVAQLRVDGSEVINDNGAAIRVDTSKDDRYTFLHKARIELYNRSSVRGSDGNLLTVQSSEADNVMRTLVDLDVQGNVLDGNITVKDDGSVANVALSNAGRINGIFTHVGEVDIQNGGHWQLAGDSDARLVILAEGGQLELGPLGAPGGHHALTVGAFDGQGGTVHFNTVLADDAANSDRLHVTGDTSGQAWVQVRNVNGQGAQTHDGIQLIQVDGNSDGAFQLNGRAVGGAYEYFLYKGAANGTDRKSWNLRSQVAEVPDLTPTPLPDPAPAPNPDPTPQLLPGAVPTPTPTQDSVPAPEQLPPAYVVRVEPGAYLSNLRAAQSMFMSDYHHRHAGQNHGRAWARVDGQRIGFDTVDRQLRIRGNSQSLHAGMDLLGDAQGSSIGVMLATGNATSTSSSQLIDGWARGKVKGTALGIYGTWRAPTDTPSYTGFYADSWVQRQRFDNRIESWMGLAPERYDSNAWQSSLEVGYAFQLSGDAVRGGVYLEPQVQVGYTSLTMASHVDSADTSVRSVGGSGIFGRAGLRLSGVDLEVGAGARVHPHLQVDWLYSRDRQAVGMNNDTIEADVPTSRIRVEGGASLRFAGGFGAWAGLSVEQKAGYHATSAQIGLNYTW